MVTKAKAAAIELKRRESPALKAYRPMGSQLPFHLSLASERLVRGGNQSGKSLSCAIEFAHAALGQPIIGADGEPLPNKFPADRPLLLWVIGLGETHIGDTIHRLLFKPGAFEVVKDKKTGEIRTFNPITDKEADKEFAPPLIPESAIEGWAWKDRARNIFTTCTLKNGTVIKAYSSKADVKQGDQVDGIWIDEDIEYPKYVSEWQARLSKRRGRLWWSSWPTYGSNDALNRMSERARKQMHSPNPDVFEIVLRFSDNPFMDPNEKRKRIEAWKERGDDEVRARDFGEFLTDSILMYPNFSMDIHGTPKPKDGYIRDSLDEVMDACRGMPPVHWTRYLVLDPGHSYTAVLFFAVPPPEEHGDHVVLFDELYLRHHDAAMTARRVFDKIKGFYYQAFIIDGRMGRQTSVGAGETVMERYSREFRKLGLLSRETGSSFHPGSDDVQGGIENARSWLTIRGNGTPRLRVYRDTTDAFRWEIRNYRKSIKKDEAQDKPADGQRDHAMDCYCEDTEVLTKSGWKKFSVLSYEDDLATVDLETNQLEYQHPTHLIAKDYSGDMVEIRSHSLDALVTPNHRMVVYPRVNRNGRQVPREELEPIVKSAADLSIWDAVKLCSRWEGKHSDVALVPEVSLDRGKRRSLEKEINPLLLAEFLGWYVAEGSLGIPQCPGRGYQVIVSQTPGPKLALLEALVRQLPWKFHRSKNGVYASSKQLWQYVEPLRRHCTKKRVPQWIKDSPPEVIRRFLHGAIMGDGWTQGGIPTYATTSPKLADDIQELFMKIGVSASLRVQPPRDGGYIRGHKVKGLHPQYWVRQYTKPHRHLRDYRNRPSFREKHYEGRVYCASVPNTTLIVRRNGRPIVSGNCLRYAAMNGLNYVPLKDKLDYLPPSQVWQEFQKWRASDPALATNDDSCRFGPGVAA